MADQSGSRVDLSKTGNTFSTSRLLSESGRYIAWRREQNGYSPRTITNGRLVTVSGGDAESIASSSGMCKQTFGASLGWICRVHRGVGLCWVVCKQGSTGAVNAQGIPDVQAADKSQKRGEEQQRGGRRRCRIFRG